jgi:hypothetical protein
MVTNAPWYVPNHALHTDLQMPTIREEITRLSSNYKDKIKVHPNKLMNTLLVKQGQGRLHHHSTLFIFFFWIGVQFRTFAPWRHFNQYG